jgi:hypothetical protein
LQRDTSGLLTVIRSRTSGSHRTLREVHPVFLTRCRDCSSRLLQLERIWLLPDGRHVARRRCPECELVDHVTASAEALWVWRRLARSQRDGLELPFPEPFDGVADWEPHPI